MWSWSISINSPQHDVEFQNSGNVDSGCNAVTTLESTDREQRRVLLQNWLHPSTYSLRTGIDIHSVPSQLTSLATCMYKKPLWLKASFFNTLGPSNILQILIIWHTNSLYFKIIIIRKFLLEFCYNQLQHTTLHNWQPLFYITPLLSHEQALHQKNLILIFLQKK